MLTVKIIPNEKGSPAGKLADAELYFTAPAHTHDYGDRCLKCAEALAGLKLIGFGIWETRAKSQRSVTFPARSYSVNGERRSFALLRPVEDFTANEGIKALILDAYAEYEKGTV